MAGPGGPLGSSSWARGDATHRQSSSRRRGCPPPSRTPARPRAPCCASCPPGRPTGSGGTCHPAGWRTPPAGRSLCSSQCSSGTGCSAERPGVSATAPVEQVGARRTSPTQPPPQGGPVALGRPRPDVSASESGQRHRAGGAFGAPGPGMSSRPVCVRVRVQEMGNHHCCAHNSTRSFEHDLRRAKTSHGSLGPFRACVKHLVYGKPH